MPSELTHQLRQEEKVKGKKKRIRQKSLRLPGQFVWFHSRVKQNYYKVLKKRLPWEINVFDRRTLTQKQMASILWMICSRRSEAAQLRSDEGLAVFCTSPIMDASCCVSRQQFVSDRPLFKSRGLVSGGKVCCDLTLMGQIVPVKSDCVCAEVGGSYIQ